MGEIWGRTMNYQRDLFQTKTQTRIVSFEVETELFLRFQEVIERKGRTWKDGLREFMERAIEESGAI